MLEIYNALPALARLTMQLCLCLFAFILLSYFGQIRLLPAPAKIRLLCRSMPQTHRDDQLGWSINSPHRVDLMNRDSVSVITRQ